MKNKKRMLVIDLDNLTIEEEIKLLINLYYFAEKELPSKKKLKIYLPIFNIEK